METASSIATLKIAPVQISTTLLEPGLWQFPVKDNGIPEAYCRQIFEPFQRLRAGEKREGTCLSLAMPGSGHLKEDRRALRRNDLMRV